MALRHILIIDDEERVTQLMPEEFQPERGPAAWRGGKSRYVGGAGRA